MSVFSLCCQAIFGVAERFPALDVHTFLTDEVGSELNSRPAVACMTRCVV